MHDQLVEENKANPIAGGSFGKHKVCPKDAEEAHRLASGLFSQFRSKKLLLSIIRLTKNSYI